MRAHLRPDMSGFASALPCPSFSACEISFIKNEHPPDQDYISHSQPHTFTHTSNIKSFIHNQQQQHRKSKKPQAVCIHQHDSPAILLPPTRSPVIGLAKNCCLESLTISTQNVELIQITSFLPNILITIEEKGNVGHSNLLPRSHCSGKALV
jgi:hypothetical protein